MTTSPPSGSETGEILPLLKQHIDSALHWHPVFEDGRGGNDLTKEQTSELLCERLLAALTRAQPQSDGEALTRLIETHVGHWLKEKPNMLVTGFPTAARQDIRDLVNAILARPAPSETACDQVQEPTAPNSGWLKPALDKAAVRASEMPNWMTRQPEPSVCDQTRGEGDDLSFVVEYCRRDMGYGWTAMAAFDREGAAKAYLDKQSTSESWPWIYRLRPGLATPPTGSSPGKRDELPNASSPGSGLTVRDSGTSE